MHDRYEKGIDIVIQIAEQKRVKLGQILKIFLSESTMP